MKYIYFLIFLNAFSLNAQTPLDTLVNNNWRLIEYDDGSELGMYDFLNNPELDQISLNFFIENEVLYYKTQVCRTKTGTIGEITQDGSGYNFQFGDFEIEGNECVETDSQIFENAYFGHIYDEYGYWFYITENENGSLNLSLSSSNFCTAIFTNELLSNHEVPLKSISIYPNPVLDKLIIENPKLEIDKISITDVNGKQIFQQKLNSSKIKIDFSAYPKGAYFLRIDSNGKLQIEKIIKK